MILNLSPICGKEIMNCEAKGAFFLNIMQLFVHSLMTSCPDTTHNLLDNIDNK